MDGHQQHQHHMEDKRTAERKSNQGTMVPIYDSISEEMSLSIDASSHRLSRESGMSLMFNHQTQKSSSFRTRHNSNCAVILAPLVKEAALALTGGTAVPHQINVARQQQQQQNQRNSMSASFDDSASQDILHNNHYDSESPLTPAATEIAFRIQHDNNETRNRLFSSINWLGGHVPTCVLNRLLKEVRAADAIGNPMYHSLNNNSTVNNATNPNMTLSLLEEGYEGHDDEGTTMDNESVLSDLSDMDDLGANTLDTITRTARRLSSSLGGGNRYPMTAEELARQKAQHHATISNGNNHNTIGDGNMVTVVEERTPKQRTIRPTPKKQPFVEIELPPAASELPLHDNDDHHNLHRLIPKTDSVHQYTETTANTEEEETANNSSNSNNNSNHQHTPSYPDRRNGLVRAPSQASVMSQRSMRSNRSAGSMRSNRSSASRRSQSSVLKCAASELLSLQKTPWKKQTIPVESLIRRFAGKRVTSSDNDNNTQPLLLLPSSRNHHARVFNKMPTSSDDERERHDMARRELGIGQPYTYTTGYQDPFPYDSDDEQQKRARQAMKKQQSARRLGYSRTTSRKNLGSNNNSNSHSGRTIENNTPKGTNGDSSNKWSATTTTLPFASQRESAILFIDISGFTKLSTLLDPECLSKAINSYFQLIVNEVTAHGGDVLKFAGDAIYAEWRLPSPDTDSQLLKSTRSFVPASIGECVVAAAICGAKIVADFSDFPIQSDGQQQPNSPQLQQPQQQKQQPQQNGNGSSSQQTAILNVYCGLGSGRVSGIHVGDNESRREFVILGDPIDQTADASHCAKHGEVVSSHQALQALATVCELDEQLNVGLHDGPQVIATRTHSKFSPWSHIRKAFKQAEADRQGNTEELSGRMEKGLSTEALKRYRHLISLYAHPVVVDNDTAVLDVPRSVFSAQERHREEAELRKVFVMFITPLISVQVSGDESLDQGLFSLLDSIMNLTTRELTKFSGHLRQFIVDDKGVVLIGTFGLRGSTFPNMVAEFALPCAITIHNALTNELGVQNQVGATIGKAYCGVVGGIKRHEYAILGPSVNLAARLMSSPKNPGILVDNDVRMMADKSFGFNALAPVKAKGYAEPVPIFEPLSPLDRSWGRVQPNFVGRRSEIKAIMSLAREMTTQESPSKIVFLTGDSGMGKSTLLVHVIEHIRRSMKTRRRRLIISKRVSKKTNRLVPFGVFSSILHDVLEFCQTWSDDRSIGSRAGSIYSLNSLDWESLSGGASFGNISGATGIKNPLQSAERLHFVCTDINAPQDFADLVGRRILGFDVKGKAVRRNSLTSHTPGKSKHMAGFMAKAFSRCVQEADLSIVALDDVHNMDEMSWKAVEELFYTTHSILIICTSKTPPRAANEAELPFLETLREKYSHNGRFTEMAVDRLDDDEIKSMIAKTLGLQIKDVTSQLLNNVVAQSQGMPHFANEILETIKRKHNSDAATVFHRSGTEAGPNEPGFFGSVNELILHRIDSFDATVRNILSIAAVLGTSFDLVELVAVVRETLSDTATQEKTPLQLTKGALQVVMEEGILFMSNENADDDDLATHRQHSHSSSNLSNSAVSNSTSTGGSMSMNIPFRFTFCHDIWRSTILKLMLDSRKRDIHRTIAKTLEAHLGDRSDDYLSRVKLFSHWRASGESSKAVAVVLSVGKSYEEMGMVNQSILLYQEALRMWNSNDDSMEYISDGPQETLDSLSVDDLENIIKVYIALARSFSTAHRGQDSIAAYQDALKVLSLAESSDGLSNRSILFPIFNGLFVALRFGQIQQDEECSYEQSLVSQFVVETRLHGDPIHYAGALAMQMGMFGRLGKFDKAIESFKILDSFYVPEEHSARLCAAHATDRAAECFGLCALCYMQQQDEVGNKEASALCDRILKDLMPKLNLRNVHNSFLVLFPALLVMKEHGRSLEAKRAFQMFVTQPFDLHYKGGDTTTFMDLYDPILMWLDLSSGTVNKEVRFDCLDWALVEDNLEFGPVLNRELGALGCCADSISAEICLLLAKKHQNRDETVQLIQSGLDVAMGNLSLTQQQRMYIARDRVLPVYKGLMTLAESVLEGQTECVVEDNVGLYGKINPTEASREG